VVFVVVYQILAFPL